MTTFKGKFICRYIERIYLTEEEFNLIFDYTCIKTGIVIPNEIWRKASHINYKLVVGLLKQYNDDGYGDKPIDMNRVEYCLSQIKN